MLIKRKNLILIGIYVAGILFFPRLVGLLIAFIRGYTYEYARESMYVLSLTNFIIYAMLCGILLRLTCDIFKQDFQRIGSWGAFFKQMGFGLLCTFGAALLGNSIVMLLGTIETAMNQELVVTALATRPFLMIITIVFLGPIVEEIIFRLVLMNLFNWRPIHNVIISSLIFGLVHVLIGGLIHIIPYFLMGLVLGYFYLKHNNAWHITILHILHNGLTVVLVFWSQHMLDLYASL